MKENKNEQSALDLFSSKILHLLDLVLDIQDENRKDTFSFFLKMYTDIKK